MPNLQLELMEEYLSENLSDISEKSANILGENELIRLIKIAKCIFYKGKIEAEKGNRYASFMARLSSERQLFIDSLIEYLENHGYKVKIYKTNGLTFTNEICIRW